MLGMIAVEWPDFACGFLASLEVPSSFIIRPYILWRGLVNFVIK